MTAMDSSMEVRGTVFWIVASGLIYLAVVAYSIRTDFYATGATVSYGITEIVIVVFYFILVYPCLGHKAWGFVASMALGIFGVVGTLVIEGPADQIDVLFILMGLLTTYFSYIGYLKVRLH